MVELQLVLIAAAITGAALNVLRGWSKSDDSFSLKKAVGAGITAGIAALAAVSIFDIATLGGVVQVILLGLLAGFSADVAIGKLKK